jgi:hypothetical protein
MKNNVLRALYSRLCLSRLYSRLDSINLLYSAESNDQYVEKMKIFYSELSGFRQTYITNYHVKNLYAAEGELLLAMEKAVVNKAASELHDLSNRIRMFLDKLYDAAFTTNASTSSRSAYARGSLLAVLLIFLLAVSYTPLKKKYRSEREQYDLAANEDLFKQRTKEDIFELEKALNKYYHDNKSYPKSSGGWDAIISIYGQSKGDWIPGLAPKYIKKLPVDPRKVKDPVKQYMYMSDGTNYKLIAHFPVGMNDIINEYPQLVDPRRPSWAFGVWTEAAKNW